MTRIAIVNSSIEDGDAISNDMLGMYRVLSGQRYEVGLFAESSSIDTPWIQPAAQIQRFLKSSTDILIYHYATGWEAGLRLLKKLTCRKIVKYHNVTPPECFTGINSEYEQVCRTGREFFTELVDVDADLYMADSEYSRREMVSFGVEESKACEVPPFHHIDRLIDIEADLQALDRFNDDNINILTVGRLAPNKGHHVLIDAFAHYLRGYNVNSRLLIVGGNDPKLKAYADSLHRKAIDFGLDNRVVFTGKVSDAALKAYYLVSDIFMITSLHEGFCVPVVEAMSMKIPIVAYGSSAIPYTVGNAGIVWDENDPELMAASVNEIAVHDNIRFALSEMGWNCYQNRFSSREIEVNFMEKMRSVL
jgi:glycosyltransferase involved in cell wall biosynthesis